MYYMHTIEHMIVCGLILGGKSNVCWYFGCIGPMLPAFQEVTFSCCTLFPPLSFLCGGCMHVSMQECILMHVPVCSALGGQSRISDEFTVTVDFTALRRDSH